MRWLIGYDSVPLVSLLVLSSISFSSGKIFSVVAVSRAPTRKCREPQIKPTWLPRWGDVRQGVMFELIMAKKATVLKEGIVNEIEQSPHKKHPRLHNVDSYETCFRFCDHSCITFPKPFLCPRGGCHFSATDTLCSLLRKSVFYSFTWQLFSFNCNKGCSGLKGKTWH